jgi:hypothetical protein
MRQNAVGSRQAIFSHKSFSYNAYYMRSAKQASFHIVLQSFIFNFSPRVFLTAFNFRTAGACGIESIPAVVRLTECRRNKTCRPYKRMPGDTGVR